MISHYNIPPVIIVFLLWNVAGFMLIGFDKRRAVRRGWRIRERTFFLWALAAGAAGILLAMYVFRHKTSHRSFVVGMPILVLFNLVSGYFLWRLL